MIGRQTHESRLAYLFYFINESRLAYLFYFISIGLDVFEFIVHFKS